VFWFILKIIIKLLGRRREKEYRKQFNDFNGFAYDVQSLKDISEGIKKINSGKFKALCYINKQERRN
jgi:hypothetical protein